MNLELVPCMFKRAGDGNEAQCMGLIIRAPGVTAMATLPPSSMGTSSVKTSQAKAPVKLQPKPSGIVPITPKIAPSSTPTVIPAMVTTTASTTNVTVTSNSGQIGVGSMIQLPLSAVSQAQGGPVHLTISKPTKKPSKPKSKRKDSKMDDHQPPSNTSRSSFDMQSPPQIVPEQNNYAPATSSYLHPISSIAPSTYQAAASSTNGCTQEDINAINIAHDLSNEQEVSRNYWQNQNSHQSAQYYGHEQNYGYSSAGSGFNPPHDNYQQNSNPDYPQQQQNGTQYVYNQPQGHHGNHQQWVGQRPLQYPGQNNQMTSSTPDSGIQSIDGSPPSSSAFTPPMVSPYPVQANHYDHGLQSSLGLPSLSLHSQLPTGSMSNLHPNVNTQPPQQSHIQLPPLNCRIPTSSTGPQTFCPVPPASFLDNQQPSCSYSAGHCDTELDDIRIDPMRSISPPALDSEKRPENENDSDVDYAEMPTLVRADDPSRIIVEQSEEEASGICENPSRTSSRISSLIELQKKEDEIAISANMNANEIANKLLSSLPMEKVQELLKHIIPIDSTSDVRPSSAKSSRRNSKRRPSPPPSTPPPTIERPLTRSSLRSPSLVRSVSVQKTVKKEKKAKTQKEPLKEQKQQPKRPAKGKPGPPLKKNGTKSKTNLTSKKVGRRPKNKEKTSITVLKKHPYSNFYRPRAPIRVFNDKKVHSSATNKFRQLRPPKTLSRCPDLDDVIASLAVVQKPSNLLQKRYDGVANQLADLLSKTHLKLPKIETIRWEPSGSWKSCFQKTRKRKPIRKESKPLVVAKKPKVEKTGPLKISIAKETKAPKKRLPSAVTPVSRDDYVKIRSNVPTEAPIKLSLASKMCECTEKDPCTSTSNCVTRSAYTECTQYSCQLYSCCQNRRLMNNEGVHQLQLFKKNPMNNGVRSLVDIFKGQLVTEFVGEILRKDTYLKRLENSQSYPHYAVELIPGSYVIDASRKGNLSRFMNHSCKPNCIMQRWVVNGQQRIGIFALESIVSGVELTYDYSMHVYLPNDEIKCLCGSTECRQIIPSMPPPNKAPRKPNKLTKQELQLVRNGHCFLRRNILKYKSERKPLQLRGSQFLPEITSCLAEILNDFMSYCKKEQVPRRWLNFVVKNVKNTFTSLSSTTHPSTFIDNFDAAVKYSLGIISKSMEHKKGELLQQQYLSLKRQSDIMELMKENQDALLAFLAERRKPSAKKAEHSPKILSVTPDLSYMDSDTPVGSYNPDKDSALKSETPTSSDGDSVRCVCGIMDEGGLMCQCDRCHYWLHGDCLGIKKEIEGEFICIFCEKELASTPLLDIPLIPQPELAFDKCIYYRTLVNCRGIQARINECVYMEKIINDEYKKRLKRFNEEYVDGKPVAKKKKKPSRSEIIPEPMQEPPEDIFKPDIQKLYDRKDLRVFRIVRLFKVPTGERFAFGCYYARPHETFVDPGRMFYKNELFCTPLFDTLPVDAIVGRCLVLEPADYAIGRPKGPHYIEDDVFVCEYAIDRSQKQFEKLTEKNRYPINTADYLFDRFEKPLTMKRNFTPFIIKTGRNAGGEKNSNKVKLSSIVKDTSSLCLNKVIDRIQATLS